MIVGSKLFYLIIIFYYSKDGNRYILDVNNDGGTIKCVA